MTTIWKFQIVNNKRFDVFNRLAQEKKKFFLCIHHQLHTRENQISKQNSQRKLDYSLENILKFDLFFFFFFLLALWFHRYANIFCSEFFSYFCFEKEKRKKNDNNLNISKLALHHSHAKHQHIVADICIKAENRKENVKYFELKTNQCA